VTDDHTYDVVVVGAGTVTTALDGSVQLTNPNPTGVNTVSVFATGFAYVTVVGTSATDILVALNLSLANSNSLFAAWKKLPIAVASWVSTTLRRMGRKSGLKSHARQENLLFLNV